MSTWHYECGQWTETTFLDDARQEAPQELQSWDEVRSHLGYEYYTELGSSNCWQVAIYEREAAPRYLVEFSDCDRWDSFTVATLPDAMDLLARYAPIVTAAEVARAAEDIRDRQPYGVVSDVLVSAEVNAGSVAAQVRSEREMRAAQRRTAQERKGQAAG